MTSTTPIPVPPANLHQRVAGPSSDEHNYEENGRRAREDIVGLLPADWDWDGKRLLDFGCGPGRVLRQFMPESELAELHGCDIYGPGIAWLHENAPPHVKVFVNEELPPLDRPDSHFDLVYAVSVFTHLVDSWSRWLLELHRVLKPGGLFVTTFHNEANHADFAAYDPEPWSEGHVGMNVMSPSVGWDKGGPAVFHSAWWLEAHWGRLFEIRELRRTGFGGLTQGVVLLAKKDVRLEAADLEQPEPGEPREYEAARHNVRQLRNEIAILTADRDAKAAELEAHRAPGIGPASQPTPVADLQAELAKHGHWYHTINLPGGFRTPGMYDMPRALGRVGLPASLEGQRCLDIGTGDGFWAFEMERRGASEVVALDLGAWHLLDWPPARGYPTEGPPPTSTRFDLARQALGSSVEWRQGSIYDLSPAAIGVFDFVLIGSMLLHLRDPVRALAAARTVTRGRLLVNEAISPLLTMLAPGVPAAILFGMYVPTWWIPNPAGLRRLTEAAGFEVLDSGRPYYLRYGAGRSTAEEQTLAAITTKPLRALPTSLARNLRDRLGKLHTWVLVAPK